jgi:hypothetical protein
MLSMALYDHTRFYVSLRYHTVTVRAVLSDLHPAMTVLGGSVGRHSPSLCVPYI